MHRSNAYAYINIIESISVCVYITLLYRSVWVHGVIQNNAYIRKWFECLAMFYVFNAIRIQACLFTYLVFLIIESPKL